MTGIVDRMEAAGLVERARSAGGPARLDHSAHRAGRKVAERAKVSPWDVLRQALAELSAPDQEKLTSLMRKVALNVQSAVQPRRAKENANGSRR